MEPLETPADWARAIDAIDAALAVHRQHLAAARRALAENDDGRLAELLTELLTRPRVELLTIGDARPVNDTLDVSE